MDSFTRITSIVLPLKSKSFKLSLDGTTKEATKMARTAIERTIHITQEQIKETELTQLSVSMANAALTMVTELASAVSYLVNNPEALDEAAQYTNPHREAFDKKLESGMMSGLYHVEGDNPQDELDRCVLLCVTELTAFYAKAIVVEMCRQAYH